MAPPTLVDLKYCTLAFYIVAAVITIARIVIRLRKRLFWWDDFWAIFSLVCFTIVVPSIFVIADAPSFPPHIRVAGYYLVASFFFGTVWAARLSIVFTVVRIAPQTYQKVVMLVVAALMIFQWLLLEVQMIWVCEKMHTSWKTAPFPLCPLGLRVAITHAITETVSDIILIAAPLWILRKINVSPTIRLRLMSVFACSLITTLVALAHAILVFRSGVWEAIIGALEDAVALAVCNLSVIVPVIARFFGGDPDKYRDESKNHPLVTIGGTGASKNTRNLDDTMLSTFMVNRTTPQGAVRVDVTVEQEQANWETKRDVEAGSGGDVYHLPLHKG